MCAHVQAGGCTITVRRWRKEDGSNTYRNWFAFYRD